MIDILRLLAYALTRLFRSRARLETAILVLRHQFNVLRRKAPKNRKQARVILGYIHKTLHAVPQLKDMIERAGVEEIELTNKLAIEATTANIGSSRGRMVVAALCDEIAFWATDEDSASPDEDVLNALRPGMATIPNAMLLVASSPVCEARRVVEHLQAVRRCSGVHIGRYLENQAPDKEHIRFIRLKKFSDRL